jgi:DNA polymerase III epsilon subunit-like protein
MSYIVVFDTETTGLLPKKITKTTLDICPYILQLSAVKYNLHTNSLDGIFNELVKIDGVVPEESFNVHGITTEMSHIKGNLILDVLERFFEFIGEKTTTTLIAHNMEYDFTMIMIELMRNKNCIINNLKLLKNKLKFTRLIKSKINNEETKLMENIRKICLISSLEKICTMKLFQYKHGGGWIKLIKLHEYYFNVIPNNMHDALNDTVVCLRCFYKMKYNKDICLENVEIENYISNLI